MEVFLEFTSVSFVSSVVKKDLLSAWKNVGSCVEAWGFSPTNGDLKRLGL